MDKDALYYHFANLALVLIGLFSIQSILNPFVAIILIPGTIAGFLVSWQIRNARPQYMDIFTGMLSLAAVVIVLGRLYDTAITFENLLKIFSITLVWLTLFQSFGLKTGKSYAMLQFISVCLLISSIGLVLEEESAYIILLALFLFIFIFAMRLNLVCEKKIRGSLIIGDQQNIMSLWQQIKVAALMFSFVLLIASFIYPFVPRFENLSLRWIPSTLLGIPEQIPLLKLLKEAPEAIRENRKRKEEQRVDDGSRKRETSAGQPRKGLLERRNRVSTTKEKEVTKRFPAREFNRDVDIFKIESLIIKSDRDEVPLDGQCKLKAELQMGDGSIIPATRLVDWMTSGTAKVSIDSNGNLSPKSEGYINVSATYIGSFSNDLHLKIVEPVVPVKKKGWVYYLFFVTLWLFLLTLLCLVVWIFIRGKRLSELALRDPKEFIKLIYISLCRAFKIYGVSRFNYIAPREFFELVRMLVSSRPEPMRLMTESVLEARFSKHEILAEDSRKALELFREVKGTILEREGPREFWKKILFRLLLLDVSLASE